MNRLKRTIPYIDTDGSVNKKDIWTREKKKSAFNIAKYMNVGYYLAIPLVGGVLLGVWLDSIFHTKPVFTAILIIVGLIAAFYNLYTLTKDA